MTVLAGGACGTTSSTPNCQAQASVTSLVATDRVTGDTLTANNANSGIQVVTTGSAGGSPGSITCTNSAGVSVQSLVYNHNGVNSTVTLSGCNHPSQQFGPFAIQYNSQSCPAQFRLSIVALIITDGSDVLNISQSSAQCTNCVTPCRECS
jgi:hypothetical protein